MEKLVKVITGVVYTAAIATMVGFAATLGESPAEKDKRQQEELRIINERDARITGTVVEESYQNTLKPVPEVHIEGLVSRAFSSETVKIESKYAITAKTDDGKVVAVSIIDRGDRTKESLELLIKPGTRISFPKDNIRFFNNGRFAYDTGRTTYFEPETQFGTKYADEIRILDQN